MLGTQIIAIPFLVVALIDGTLKIVIDFKMLFNRLRGWLITAPFLVQWKDSKMGDIQVKYASYAK